MLAPRELSRMIYHHRRAMAKAVASVMEGDVYRDTGDAFALFSGEGSPFGFAMGNFYPASLEVFTKLYAGREREWSATVTPYVSLQAVDTMVKAQARPNGWENVLVRSLNDLPKSEMPEDTQIERTDDLELWGRIAKERFYDDEEMNDEEADEAIRILLATPDVHRYLVRVKGEPVYAGSMFVSGGVACLDDGGLAFSPPHPDYSAAWFAQMMLDAEEDADFAWMLVDPQYPPSTSPFQLGFWLAYTQLNFCVPTR